VIPKIIIRVILELFKKDPGKFSKSIFEKRVDLFFKTMIIDSNKKYKKYKLYKLNKLY
jgi:hypothetical protein